MTKPFSFAQLEAVQLTDRPGTVTLETDMWTGVRAIPVGYQHGFDNPATYQRAASYELITAHRPLMVGVNQVTFAGFIYSKGAIGTRVGRHQWRVAINGRVSTLTLEATENRAEFEENCRRVIAFAKTLAIENGQTSDWHIHGAWGRTGVVARARLTGFAELVLSTPETTFTVQSQAVGAAVARNGFGSYIDYTGYSEYSLIGSPIEQSSLNDSLSELFDATETQPWAARDPVVCVRRMDKCYTLIHQVFDQKGNDNSMWLTLLMTVLSFIASKASGSSTKKALGTALVAGGATYLATTQTQWGQDMSKSFDDFIGVSNKDKTTVQPAPKMIDVVVGKDENGNDIIAKRPVYDPVGTTSKGSITGSLVDVWNGMSPVGKALTGGVAVSAASSFLSKYGLWIIGGAGVYLLMKD